MAYRNRRQQTLAQARSEKRLAGVPVREPSGPIQINSPRQALRAIADAVNKVRADPTIDQLTVSRLQIDAAKVANMILSSNLDAKLDELAAKVTALTEDREGVIEPKLPPLALPAGDVEEAVFTDGAPRIEPLMGVRPDALPHPDDVPKPPRNKGGRPRKDGNPPGWRPAPPIPAVPNAEQFEAAMDVAVASAADDDE